MDPLTISLLAVLLLVLLRLLKARYLLILFAILLQVRYLLWRGLYTLDTARAVGLAATLILFLAEGYGLFQNLFFYYQIKKPVQRIPGEPLEYPSVDLFVTVVNEPLEILKRTLIGCLAQDYPRDRFTVHVLDDGDREEIRRLAQELGCRYHSRPEKTHAKAGNINHTLGKTQGELVALFDVDHVPVRNFLTKTVGFFRDEAVAFVQTPHHFYNPDIFQKNLRLEREIRNEQDLFFRLIQAGRDAHNSAFFAGSSGVFRRKALEEIGGFRTDTLTEDLHTSLILHARGWKSCYLNQILSAGLSPETLVSYQKQRERWAMGAVQTLLKDNPLFQKGLSSAQRIDYFASIYYFFHGLPRVVYLAAPLSFLLFGVAPIVAEPIDLVHYFLAYYLSAVLLIDLVSRGSRRILWSDVYETVICFSLTKAVLRAPFPSSRSTFHVTPKGEVGRRHLEWKRALPHILLLSATLVGITRGVTTGSPNSGALWISLFWACFNVLLLCLAILAFLERPQRRRLLRLRRTIPCTIRNTSGEAVGTTLDLSESGASLQLQADFVFTEPDVEIQLKSAYGETTVLKARIRSQERHPSGTQIGVAFHAMGEDTYRSLVRQMYSAPESWEQGVTRKGLLGDMLLPVLGLIGPWRKDRKRKRLYPRVPLQRACTVATAEQRLSGRTTDASYSGLSLLLRNTTDITLAAETRLEIDDVVLLVTPVAAERIRGRNKVHFKIQSIAQGETSWKNMVLPSSR